VGKICRKMGVGDATFHRRRKVYARMGASEIRRFKQREEEHAKLKR
jgi:putative transposase